MMFFSADPFEKSGRLKSRPYRAGPVTLTV